MNSRVLIAVPYACVRVPLGVVDTTLARWLPGGSGVRTGFDCALGALDVWAGHLLQDQRIISHGAARVGAAAHLPGPPTDVPGGRTRRRRSAPPKTYATTRAWTRSDDERLARVQQTVAQAT